MIADWCMTLFLSAPSSLTSNKQLAIGGVVVLSQPMVEVLSRWPWFVFSSYCSNPKLHFSFSCDCNSQIFPSNCIFFPSTNQHRDYIMFCQHISYTESSHLKLEMLYIPWSFVWHIIVFLLAIIRYISQVMLTPALAFIRVCFALQYFV